MAGRLDLVINKGSTFERVFTWQTRDTTTGATTAVDLTDFRARMMMREEIDSPTPFLTLTSENGMIALGGEDGTITVTIPATESTALNVERGVWDIELYSILTDYVIRLLEGKVKLTPEVTR